MTQQTPPSSDHIRAGYYPTHERVRVARALPELAAISTAFREGRVSYSKVRAMTRVATAENEGALLQIASHGTASHVETQVRLYRKVKRIEALAWATLLRLLRGIERRG